MLAVGLESNGLGSRKFLATLATQKIPRRCKEIGAASWSVNSDEDPVGQHDHACRAGDITASDNRY